MNTLFIKPWNVFVSIKDRKKISIPLKILYKKNKLEYILLQDIMNSSFWTIATFGNIKFVELYYNFLWIKDLILTFCA